MDLKHVSNAPPPPQNIGFFSKITQQLLAWETAFKKALQEGTSINPDLESSGSNKSVTSEDGGEVNRGAQERSGTSALFGRIIRNAQRTFGYDKDDLAGTFLDELTAYLANRRPTGLPENYHYRLYNPVLKEMELSYWNGAEQGAISVLHSASYPSAESPEKRFLTYYWKDKEIPFKKNLEDLQNTQGFQIFNEETIRGAVNILYHYCQEQFVRGYYQGKNEATLSPENLCRKVANLIPDRAQG